MVSWNNVKHFEASYKAPKLLSATGAGDTTIAAFLTAFLNGNSPGEALRLAAATGALCVSEYDSQSGLKPLDEVQKMIDSGWEKNIT
jgi:sugar/nucleoside kinase (ribokinase family)